MSHFTVRCLTSLVLVALALAVGIFRLEAVSVILGTGLVGVLLWEYHRLVFFFDSFKLYRWCFVVLGVACFLVQVLGITPGGEKMPKAFILSVLAFFVMSFWFLFLKGYPKASPEKNLSATPFSEWAGVVGATWAVFYIILPMVVLLRMFVYSEKGWMVIALALGMVCSGDSVAYLAGQKFGGRSWMNHISPGKTRVGLWSGAGACGLGAVLVPFLLVFPTEDALILTILNTGGAKLLAVVLVLFVLGGVCFFLSQTGDLFVSALKRRAGVKNTGRLLPGHGGFLDRLDGFLLVWLFVYATIQVP